MFFNKDNSNDYVHCATCGVVIKKDLAQNKVEVVSYLAGYGDVENTRYYCEAHKKPYDKVSGGVFTVAYYKTFEVNEDGSIIKPPKR